jgi:hypothetical protein
MVKDIQPISGINAVFGNGNKSTIESKGSMKQPGLDELFIMPDGVLTKSYLSVSQLATKSNMPVVFTKDGCYVMKEATAIKLRKADVQYFIPLDHDAGLYQAPFDEVLKNPKIKMEA